MIERIKVDDLEEIICPVEAKCYKVMGIYVTEYACGRVETGKEIFPCKDYQKCPYFIASHLISLHRMKREEVEKSKIFKDVSEYQKKKREKELEELAEKLKKYEI